MASRRVKDRQAFSMTFKCKAPFQKSDSWLDDAIPTAQPDHGKPMKNRSTRHGMTCQADWSQGIRTAHDICRVLGRSLDVTRTQVRRMPCRAPHCQCQRADNGAPEFQESLGSWKVSTVEPLAPRAAIGDRQAFGLVPPPDSGRDRISVHIQSLSDFVQ